jgi:hypothetical protein
MAQVGFEPTIPVFEGEKTVHALDCAAAVIGSIVDYNLYFSRRRLMDLLIYRVHSSPSFLLHNSVTVWCTHGSLAWDMQFLATTGLTTSLMWPAT